MYIDSTNETEPSGELPVAKLLQTNIEPLLKVKHCKLHPSSLTGETNYTMIFPQ